MPDFGIFRGFNDKLFGNKLYAGQLPTQLGLIGSLNFGSLLLDFYPNAAAAYSLRKLRSAYTGSAIRVRRSSDNTEQDIGFTALGALDTSSLTSFCGSGDGFVTTWYDQSGNGRNATQSTAAYQPKIVSSGSVILENGKPTIQFDGINDILTSSLWSSNIYGDYVFTIYAYNNVNQGGALWSNGNNPTLSDGYAIGIGNTTFDDDGSKFIGLYHRKRWLPTSYNLTTNQSLSLWYNQSNYSQNLYLNGIQVITSANIGDTPFIPTTKSEIGGVLENNRYANVKIQEHIYYPSDQSTNRTGIESNINTYYAIY